jgi:hypothetical protein
MFVDRQLRLNWALTAAENPQTFQFPTSWSFQQLFLMKVLARDCCTLNDQDSFLCHSYFTVFILTYGAEPFLRSCQLCIHSGNSQQF